MITYFRSLFFRFCLFLSLRFGDVVYDAVNANSFFVSVLLFHRTLIPNRRSTSIRLVVSIEEAAHILAEHSTLTISIGDYAFHLSLGSGEESCYSDSIGFSHIPF